MGLYYSIDEFENAYFPNFVEYTKKQTNQIEPQKIGNTFATELLDLIK